MLFNMDEITFIYEHVILKEHEELNEFIGRPMWLLKSPIWYLKPQKFNNLFLDCECVVCPLKKANPEP